MGVQSQVSTPEAEIKYRVKRRLEECGCYWALVQNGAYAKPGDPDLISCVDGRFLAVEVKAPYGRQSDIQAIRQREIERAGGVYALVRSMDDLESAINQIRDGNDG